MENNSDSKKPLDLIFFLKYFSACTIVTAICLHAFNIHPLNVLVHLIGACTWSIVGFAWKEKSILLNFVPQVFILSAGLLWFGGCAEKDAREVSIDKLERRDLIYTKGESEPFTGTAIDYYNDGTERMRRTFLNGEIHGTQTEYTGEGVKKSETVFQKGKLHGTSIIYNENGTKWIERPFLNGQKHGTEIWYYDDKTKKSETPYVKGQRHGAQVYFYQGIKTAEIPWSEDEISGTRIEFYKNGAKKKEERYMKGSKHGKEIEFYRDGTKKLEKNWAEDKEHGKATFYREDASKYWEIFWENGVRMSRKEWDKDGNLIKDEAGLLLRRTTTNQQ